MSQDLKASIFWEFSRVSRWSLKVSELFCFLATTTIMSTEEWLALIGIDQRGAVDHFIILLNLG